MFREVINKIYFLCFFYIHMYYVVLLKRIYCMIYADAFVSQKQETYEPYYYCNVHTISTQRFYTLKIFIILATYLLDQNIKRTLSSRNLAF